MTRFRLVITVVEEGSDDFVITHTAASDSLAKLGSKATEILRILLHVIGHRMALEDK